jgi:Fur family ferric uptake transcriptional regulator
MSDSATIIAMLDAGGHQVTDARREVAALVAAEDGPFTAHHLLESARCNRRMVGRATIFRTLELLADAGAIERLDLPNGEHAYVTCEPAHHHHVVCRRCGRSTEVADCGLEAVASAIRRQTGFAIDAHRMELFGTCPDCQRALGA